MVRTQVARSVWDRRLSPNPHALTIYLEFVPARGAAPERFEECQCEDDDVRLHCRTWVPGDGHYRWLRGPINPLPLEHRAEYLARTIRRILEFLQLWSILLVSSSVVIHLRLLRRNCCYLSLILILSQSLVEVKLNKDVLGLHPKNPTSTSLVLEDHSTD